MRRLLIRPGAIGDCVVSLPALESLASDWTEVWVAGQNVPLIRFADKVSSIASTGLDLLEIHGAASSPALIERLRSFDSIISWYGSNREEFRRVTRELQLPVQFLPALPPDTGLHACEFYLRQAGARAPSAVPRIECPAARGDYCVIHPFTSSARKTWPLERFRVVAEGLRDIVRVEWCTGPEERLEGARRYEDLYELACWIASARLYIGADSGIAHLAAAVGTPVVVLFGPTDPAIWAPRGPAVRIIRTKAVGQPIGLIESSEVLSAAREALR